MKVITDTAIKETAKNYFYSNNPVGRTALMIVDEILEHTPEKEESDSFYKEAWIEMIKLNEQYEQNKIGNSEWTKECSVLNNVVKEHLKKEGEK